MKRILILIILFSFLMGCANSKPTLECANFINRIDKININNNEVIGTLTINEGFQDVGVNLYRDDFEKDFNHDLAIYFWKLTNDLNSTIVHEKYPYIGICGKLMTHQKNKKDKIKLLKEIENDFSSKFNNLVEKHIEKLQFKTIKGCESFAESIDKLQFKLFYEKDKELKKSYQSSFNSLKREYFGCIKLEKNKLNKKENNETD